MMRLENIPVYDITPPMEIAVSAWMYGIALVCIVVLYIVSVIWKRLKSTKRARGQMDHRGELYRFLLAIDLSDPKQAAYQISATGYELAKLNPSLSESYGRLNALLEGQKYALEVKPFSEETLEAYHAFCRVAYEKMS